MSITVKGNFRSALLNFKKLDKQQQTALLIGMRAGVEVWLGRQQRKQMSGRPGLRVRTGTLRRSWRTRIRYHLFGGVGISAFTEVKYARPHEYGKMRVPAHTRRQHTRRAAKGRKRVTVRAHRVRGHTVQMPVRLHMRSAFRREAIRPILQGMRREWRKARQAV